MRIVVVDDHALVREGTVQLLDAEPDFEVVGEAGTGEEALGVLDHLVPDLAIVDVNLPGISGLDVAREVIRQRRGTRVLVVSAYDDHAYVTEALDIGVGGYLLKTASAQEVIDAVRVVAAGVFVLDGAISTRIRHRSPGTRLERSSAQSFTPREKDVLRLLVEGRSNKQIASELALGIRTVETHVSSLLVKLDVSSRAEAVARALRNQLVAP